jgi:hypothetical protein
MKALKGTFRGPRQGMAEAGREQNVDGPITCHVSPFDTVTLVCSLPDGPFACHWMGVFINNSLSHEKIVEPDEHPKGIPAAKNNPLSISLRGDFGDKRIAAV